MHPTLTMLHTKGVYPTCTLAPEGTACISTSSCHTACTCCSFCTWAAACSHLSARIRARVWFCCCACCSCTCRSAGPLLAASSLPATTKTQLHHDRVQSRASAAVQYGSCAVLQLEAYRSCASCLQLACHHITAVLTTEYKAEHDKGRTTRLSCCACCSCSCRSAECLMPRYLSCKTKVGTLWFVVLLTSQLPLWSS